MAPFSALRCATARCLYYQETKMKMERSRVEMRDGGMTMGR